MTEIPFRYRVVWKDGTETPWYPGRIEYTIQGNAVGHRMIMPDLPERLGDGDQIQIDGAVPVQHPFRATN